MVHPWDQFANKPDYSRLIPCDAPGCLLENTQAWKRGEAYLADQGTVPEQTFDSWIQIPEAKEAYEAARDWAQGDAQFIHLTIYGPTGNGKTHLANASCLALNQHGVHCVLWTVSELLEHLRAAIGDSTIHTELNVLKELPVLILDDWKATHETYWSIDKLEEIVDYRYRYQKPLMITTNEQLQTIPERVIDRMSEKDLSKLVFNQAPSYRQRD